MNIHKAGMLHFATLDLQRVVRSSSRPEVSREKGTPLRKRKNKDNFRCLIIIWSINYKGPLDEGLMNFFFY